MHSPQKSMANEIENGECEQFQGCVYVCAQRHHFAEVCIHKSVEKERLPQGKKI